MCISTIRAQRPSRSPATRRGTMLRKAANAFLRRFEVILVNRESLSCLRHHLVA
jgi:hypothetical protein